MTAIDHGHAAIADFLERLSMSGHHDNFAELQIVRRGKGRVRGADNRPGSFEEKQARRQGANSKKNILDLAEGSQCKIRVMLKEDGYLHLFDLGTSGTCKKLFPQKGEMNFFRAHQTIILPSEHPDDVITVGLSTAGEKKGSENRILIIYTGQMVELGVEELDPTLVDRPASLGFRGGSPFDETSIPDDTDIVNHLEGIKWSYDLIRFTIS